jgi:hypothetical protein
MDSSYASLLRLGVRACAIDDQVVDFFRELIGRRMCPKMKSFEFSSSDDSLTLCFLIPWLAHLPNLRKLNLTLGQMSEIEKERFRYLLQKDRPPMSSLAISGNEQPFEAAAVLKASLPSMKYLNALIIFKIPETEPLAIEQILSSCSCLNNLKKLQLKEISLENEGIRLLYRVLDNMPLLQSLSLTNVKFVPGLSQRLYSDLFRLIRECRRLTYLSLLGLDIGEGNIEDLGDLCFQMKSLEKLDLRYNKLSVPALNTLFEALEKRSLAMKLLRLDGNPGCEDEEVIAKLQHICNLVNH